MEDENLPPGARWVTWVLYNTCLLGFGIILISLGAEILREIGGWALVKKLNDHAGNLLTATVAFLALYVAYREYLIRNSPLFRADIESEHMNFDTSDYDVVILSHFDKVIHLETELIQLDEHAVFVSFIRPKEILPPNGKVAVLRMRVSKQANAESALSITFRCTGKSAVTSGARSIMEITMHLPQRKLDEGYPRPNLDYNFRPFAGVFSVFN